MLNRRDMRLRIVGAGEYAGLMKRLGKHRSEESYDKGIDCFVEIEETILHDNFFSVLREFNITPRARYASIKMDDHKWLKYHSTRLSHRRERRTDWNVLDEETIKSLAKKAEDSGYLYLAFSSKWEANFIPNNELSFQIIDKTKHIIAAVSLLVPYYDWELYSWVEPPTKEYKRIRGVYAPENSVAGNAKELAHSRE